MKEMNEKLQRKMKDSLIRRERSRLRRAVLRSQGLCLSGANHGPATHGVLCERCRIIHTLSR